MKTIKLSNEKVLKVQLASFRTGQDLYQLICKELKNLNWDANQEIDYNFCKNILVANLSSKEVTAVVEDCMSSCLIGDPEEKLNTKYFEENREEYLEIFTYVLAENIQPFLKSLFALYGSKEKLLSMFLRQ